jgi:hypothetical protein
MRIASTAMINSPFGRCAAGNVLLGGAHGVKFSRICHTTNGMQNKPDGSRIEMGDGESVHKSDMQDIFLSTTISIRRL